MTEVRRKLLGEAIAHWGPAHQAEKAVEELAELIRAVARDDVDNIAEEIADVRIMIDQLEMIYGIEDRSREWEWKKLVRLKERLEEGGGWNGDGRRAGAAGVGRHGAGERGERRVGALASAPDVQSGHDAGGGHEGRAAEKAADRGAG